jgi:hypothetical protein
VEVDRSPRYAHRNHAAGKAAAATSSPVSTAADAASAAQGSPNQAPLSSATAWTSVLTRAAALHSLGYHCDRRRRARQDEHRHGQDVIHHRHKPNVGQERGQVGAQRVASGGAD